MGFKYTLFPKLDFFQYLKKIHVSYHPGRPKTEVARRMIMHMTAESTKKKYPKLEATWELLAYDAPATIQVELADGKEKRFLCEHYSKYEMQQIIDEWQYASHLEFMKLNNLE